MKRSSWSFLILFGASLLVAPPLCFAAEATPRNESLAVFVELYAKALQGRDVEAYKRLVHPRCRACINKDQGDYYELLFHRKQYLTVQTAEATFKILPESALTGMSYPLKPTHLIQVNLRLNEFKSKVLLVQVAQDNGSWFEVISCPVSEVLQTMRAAAIREHAEAARAETLLSSMRDPLRSELTTLLKQGKKVSAITRYREVSGEDLSVAKRVIELLEK